MKLIGLLPPQVKSISVEPMARGRPGYCLVIRTHSMMRISMDFEKLDGTHEMNIVVYKIRPDGVEELASVVSLDRFEEPELYVHESDQEGT